jgi:hypothetical protein
VTMPTSRPASVTGRWWMPRSTIVSSISATVASAWVAISGVVMTAATGVSRSVPGATTRLRRSRSVRNPSGSLGSPVTTTEDTCSSRMRSAAARTVSSGPQVTSGRRARSRARPENGLAGVSSRRALIAWRIRSPARWTSLASKPGMARSRSTSARGTR